MNTQLVGILNITPDSFSDGGAYIQAEQALAHTEQLINDGAHVIDIGAESTRPGATPLTAETEWKRLAPLLHDIITLAHDRNVRVSIDTRHADTAMQAIKCGADWINDVSGGNNDRLLDIVADSHATYVLMHSLSVPADPAITLSSTCNPIKEVGTFFNKITKTLEARGIPPHRVLYDPGIGFGKTAQQSLALLWRISELGIPPQHLFIGHSRKSCFRLFSDKPREINNLTLMASSFLIEQKVGYIRVHDVRSHATLTKTLSIS